MKEIIRMYLTMLKKENRINYKKLKAYRNRHVGKRCWIIGNGPSLMAQDLDKIAGEYSFASNKIYYIYHQTSWRPTYYMCQDFRSFQGILEDENSDKAKINDSEVFLSKTFMSVADHMVNHPIYYRLCKSNSLSEIAISRHFSIYAIEGLSVTYSMIQLAIYMGFSNICLLGIDHNQHMANEKNADSLHFDKNYQIALKSYPTISEYEYLTKCLKKASIECEKHNIKIYNATRGGMLEVFERKSIEQILGVQ